MRRLLKVAAVTLAITTLSAGAAFASGWQKDDKGWWYGTNADNSAWHANGWQWVDGNGDGVAECYYFDVNGYCLMNTTTPDGYKVDSNGAWLVNGAVKTKVVGSSASGSSNSSGQTSSMADGTYRVAFKQSDIQKKGEQYALTFTTYTERTFSKSYVMGLKKGDTIEDIEIYTISRHGDSIWINSTSMSGGISCWFDKVQGSNDLYKFYIEDGYGVWDASGQYTMPVASGAIFVDDKDNYIGGERKQYSFAELASNSSLYTPSFTSATAELTAKNGTITEVHRMYTP